MRIFDLKERKINMKQYVNPNVEMIVLAETDLIATSGFDYSELPGAGDQVAW